MLASRDGGPSKKICKILKPKRLEISKKSRKNHIRMLAGGDECPFIKIQKYEILEPKHVEIAKSKKNHIRMPTGGDGGQATKSKNQKNKTFRNLKIQKIPKSHIRMLAGGDGGPSGNMQCPLWHMCQGPCISFHELKLITSPVHTKNSAI